MNNDRENENREDILSDMNEQDDCCQVLDEWKEKCIRMSADFENFKRRAIKDEEFSRYAYQALVFKECIKIADNFDRAFKQMETTPVSGTSSSWLEGFLLIRKSFDTMLSQFGVEPMNNYDLFDPLYHEAIMQVSTDAHEAGSIVEVLEKGYFLQGKVLRPAKVSIAVKA